MLRIKPLLRLHAHFKLLISKQNFSSVSAVKLNPIQNIDLSFMQNKFLKFNTERMKNTKVISHRGRSDLYP